MDQVENTGVGKDREGETLLIRASLLIRSIGAAGVVFGCLMSFFCYSDYLRGNETASAGLALCFLLFPGILGIFLILYGCRFVAVNGEAILVRDIMLRRHYYRVDEIVKVTWNADGYVFWGAHGRLFKIYDCTAACGRFLQILEERGAELNIPGRSFASDRFAASHPCQEKRRFTVRSGTCSILYGGKIKINGRLLTLQRPFRKEVSCDVSELGEAKIKENKEGHISVRLYSRQHKLLFKISGFAGDTQDVHLVFALLRHLAENDVVIYGIEKTDDRVQCMLQQRFVGEEEAEAVVRQGYERLLPVIREYEAAFHTMGLKLASGPIDRAQMEQQTDGVYELSLGSVTFAYGYFFRLMKDGRFMCLKKGGFPVYETVRVMARAPEAKGNGAVCEEGLQDLLCYEPVPASEVKRVLEYFVMLAKRGKLKAMERIPEGI